MNPPGPTVNESIAKPMSDQHSENRAQRAVRDESSATIGMVLRLMRKRPELLIACWVGAIVLSVFWTLGTQKTYRSESLLRMDPTPPRPLGQRVEVVDQTSAYYTRHEFYLTEARVIRSMRVAVAVVRALGLNADPGFMGVKPGAVAAFKPASVEDAARVLIRRLSIEQVKDSSLATVQYEDTDKQRCVRVLNTVVRTYLAQNVEEMSAVSASASEWLNSQLAGLKADLEKSEVALNTFREKNDVLSASLQDRTNITSGQLELIAKDLLALETKRFELAARAADLGKIDGSDPRQAGATELLSNVVLSGLRRDYEDRSVKLEELLATYDERHPKVIAARAEIKLMKEGIAKEIRNVRDAAYGDLRRAGAQIADLKKKEEEIRKQAHESQALEIPYNQLNRTKTQNEKLYSLVLERARETDLTRMMNINNIRVIDEAIEPPGPFRPNVPLNTTAGAILGLLLGIGVTLLRDLTDRTLKTPGDVEEHLGVPCIGLLPEIHTKRDAKRHRRRRPVPGMDVSDNPDLVVALSPESGAAEAARAIRTNLMFMSPDHPYRAIAVTSAIPAEGKTTVACSLAIAMAQSGLRVLLVDTDLRRPRVHRTFRLTNDVGVTLACTGQASIDECVRQSELVPSLYVMTSGPIPPNPAEMIHSERFAELVKGLLARFDRVVFDSTPLLPVTDAAILARVVDGVVVVARGFRTQRTVTAHALKMLQDVKAQVIGVVLNAVDLSRRDYKEYYYYYRRDGYYTKDPNERNLLVTPKKDSESEHAGA